MLAIDAGNSRIVAAVFTGESIGEVFSLATREAGLLKREPRLAQLAADGAALASVRPQLAATIAAEFRAAGLELLLIDAASDFGLINAYATPASLGVDRLVNAAGARHLYGGRDLIVIDAGTATTVDYVTAGGEFLGGVIAPGLMSAAAGLRQAAPLLPPVNLAPVANAIGRSTNDCLLAGSVVGHAAMLRGLVELMTLERQSDPLVLVTGGFTPLFESWLPPAWIADVHLTLKGIRVVHERNRH